MHNAGGCCGKFNEVIVKSVTKKGITKTDYLLPNRNDAMNWARNKLGHNTTKIRTSDGRVIGLRNQKGDEVYWGHGDWYKNVGSSTFPHLNYKIGNTKGHLFLEDKIRNTHLKEAFDNYFKDAVK